MQKNAGIEPDSPTRLVIVDDADSVEYISRQPDIFAKDYAQISTLGTSRFNANGSDWQKRRDITQPIYNKAAHSGCVQGVHEAYEACLLKHNPTGIADLQSTLFEASVGVFAKAFGSDTSGHVVIEHIEDLRHGLRWLQFLSWQPERSDDRRAATQHVKAVLASLEDGLKTSGEYRNLWQHFSNNGGNIDGYNAIEELVMNIFAGIETTVATLSWVVDRMGINQAVQDRLYKEVKSGAEQLPYCECFINETMRYFPPIPYITRTIAQPAIVNGISMRPPSQLMVSIVGLHRNKDYWHEPDEFDSAREEFLEGTYNRGAFVPFFVGPRICGGMRLARIELMQGLKAIVRNFHVTRTGDEVQYDYTLALKPVDTGNVQLTRRSL
ncbi:MAG: cytochrome P450 [Anderseniella sp.]